MKYLITGGAGFIGSTLAAKLNNNCIVIDNLSTGNIKNLRDPNLLLKGDILDEKFLDAVFAKYKPQKVIHLAAQVSVPKSINNPINDADINIKGTLNIFNMCKKYKCQKIVFASSVAVYGNNDKLPLKETLKPKPINPYGISKLVTEFYGIYFYQQFGLAYTALRFANVYGPKQNNQGEGGVVSIFVDKLSKKEPITIFGNGKQTRDFIYVTDVVDATIKAAENNKTGVYNVSTNKQHSINELVALFEKKGYAAPQVIHAPKRPGDINKSLLDNNKIKKDFDWSPQYGLETGLEKFLYEYQKIH